MCYRRSRLYTELTCSTFVRQNSTTSWIGSSLLIRKRRMYSLFAVVTLSERLTSLNTTNSLLSKSQSAKPMRLRPRPRNNQTTIRTLKSGSVFFGGFNKEGCSDCLWQKFLRWVRCRKWQNSFNQSIRLTSIDLEWASVISAKSKNELTEGSGRLQRKPLYSQSLFRTLNCKLS